MTSQSPRIYIYKITFEEVLYYYYGVHKEKKFDEYYMGSPVTNKWCWELYTPKKQILEIFPYTDEGWLEANEIERRLIEPVYNTDEWCVNESCGGVLSLKMRRKVGRRNYELGLGIHGFSKEEKIEYGKKGGQKTKELGVGICGITKEQRIENGKVSGKRSYELGAGVHSRTKEQMSEDGKKAGKKVYELGIGIHALTPEQRTENSKKGLETQKELGLGIYGLTVEQRSENSKKYSYLGRETQKILGVGIYSITTEQKRESGKKSAQTNQKNKTGLYGFTTENRREYVKITNSQRWECCETGYVSTAAGVVQYQKGKGIDTSKKNRKRVS
jgi:hypothetical protein